MALQGFAPWQLAAWLIRLAGYPFAILWVLKDTRDDNLFISQIIWMLLGFVILGALPFIANGTILIVFIEPVAPLVAATILFCIYLVFGLIHHWRMEEESGANR